MSNKLDGAGIMITNSVLFFLQVGVLGKDILAAQEENVEDANVSLKTDSTLGYSSIEAPSLDACPPSSMLVLPELSWRLARDAEAEKIAKMLSKLQKDKK